MKTNNYFIMMAGIICLASTAHLSAETHSVTPTSASTATPTTNPQASANKPPAPIVPEVSRAAFTTGIVNREPVDQLSTIQTGQAVNYFSELKGLKGRVITHRWDHEGQFKLGLQFPVNGQRWRVHSSKTLHADAVGAWTVSVINDDGTVLKKDTLVVTKGDTQNSTTQAPTKVILPTPAQAKLTVDTKSETAPTGITTTTAPQPANKANQASSVKSSDTPQKSVAEKSAAPEAKSPEQSAKPAQPLMPELPEIQPPALTPSKDQATTGQATPTPDTSKKTATNNDSNAQTNTNTEPARKPIWEVLPQ